ncbi:hypothetical protein C8R42DRAFT_14431 [Lentinula raphanica]|nr:hypothetical protein C8R42DRAFT_14431 [Lentinula raphanica]
MVALLRIIVGAMMVSKFKGLAVIAEEHCIEHNTSIMLPDRGPLLLGWHGGLGVISTIFDSGPASYLWRLWNAGIMSIRRNVQSYCGGKELRVKPLASLKIRAFSASRSTLGPSVLLVTPSCAGRPSFGLRVTPSCAGRPSFGLRVTPSCAGRPSFGLRVTSLSGTRTSAGADLSVVAADLMTTGVAFLVFVPVSSMSV